MSHDTWTLIAARLGGRISPISVTHGNVIPLYANYRCLFTAGRTLLTALLLSFIKVKLETSCSVILPILNPGLFKSLDSMNTVLQLHI